MTTIKLLSAGLITAVMLARHGLQELFGQEACCKESEDDRVPHRPLY
jgi:hypothetical protein